MRIAPLVHLAALAVLTLTACSSDDDPAGPDTGAATGQPAPVTDLHVTGGTDTSLALAWTTPGVPGDDRPLVAYDLRRIPLGQEFAGWDDWMPVAVAPPAAPGTAAAAAVGGLAAGSTWVLRLRARGAGAWSALSAPVVASAAPQWDQTPPAAVADFTLRWRSEDQLTVSWSPTGDDAGHGEAAGYEVRHAVAPLTPATWEAAAVAPAPVHDPALDRWTCHVTGLDPAATAHLAVRAVDDAGHWSGLSAGVVAAPPAGQVWHVRVDGSGTVPTIAEGIRQAGFGDLVLVHPGRYTWTNQGGPMHDLGLVFVGRDTTDFTLASAGGPEVTILDAEERGRVLFVQGYNDGLVIEGFTITGGVSTPADGETAKAGGLTFHLTSTTIRDCVFVGNRGELQGGAVYYGGVGAPTFERCVFRDNHAGDCGGAVFAVNVHGPGQDPTRGIAFIDCVFEDNTAGRLGGGLCLARAVARLEDCVIAGNTAPASGGGVVVGGHAISGSADTWVDLVRCTLAGNASDLGAALRTTIESEEDRPGRARLVACLVTGHEDADWLSARETTMLQVGCSDLFGNGGVAELPAGCTDLGDNFWLDPLLCGGAGDARWSLQPGSPCLPGAHPAGAGCGPVGARGVGCGR